jgi:hypothetical protein
MRLPVEPLPASEPAEDLYAIRRRGPVPLSSQVAPRTLPPLIVPPRVNHNPEPARAAEEAGPRAPAGSEEREGEDRRRVCRRVVKTIVLLDTRSGEDRRRHARREEDPVTGVDKKV